MYFNYDILPMQVYLFAAGMAALVVAFTIFFLKTRAVVRRSKDCEAEDIDDGSRRWERASIVVYSPNDSSFRPELITELLGQDYPTDFEVIVVNESQTGAVSDVVEPLQMQHSNLYLTYTPDGVRNLSRKKLAVTIGVKAARHPVVVLTCADAVVSSPMWLRRMMCHFADGSATEVVLGYATAAPYDDKCFGARRRSFDAVADGAAWLGDAVSGHPWRGISYNLAYRSELFFKNKGFSRRLNLLHGDDDIFVSEIARGYNTEVELSADSVVEIPGGNSPRAVHGNNICRRFTRRFIPRRPRIAAMTSWWCYLLAAVLPIAAAALQPMNWASWACAAVALLLWYPAALVWRPVCRVLFGRRMLLSLPLLAATRPLRLMYRAAYCMTHRGKRYTWQ